MSPTEAESAQLHPPPRRRRRWKRWVLIVPLGLAAVVLLLLQTPAAGWIVRPILAAQTGMRVQTGFVRVSPLGNVVIRDARLSAPSIDGPAGEVLSAERIEARIDWPATLTGSPGLKSLRLVGPDLRLSQDIDTGVINAASFKLFDGGGGGGGTPTVIIERGSIELGEHRGADFTPLRRWSVRGDVGRADASGVTEFSIVAIPSEATAGGSATGSFALVGTVGPDGVQATLDGLRLEDWPASIVPTRVRPIYQRLDLRGRILPTTFTLSPDGLVVVRMTLDGVDLNLPFNESYSMEGAGELLRMRDTRGSIAFGTAGVEAELNGTLDELRYDVRLDYNGLDAEAPFDARLATRFRMDDRFRPRRFLPVKAIEKLDMFNSPEGDIDALVRVRRADRGGRVDISGEARIANGRAAYRKLPYPFTDISGVVEFTEDRLVIKDITGRGPTGATMSAEGLFDGLGEDSAVELRLGVRGMLIDDALLAALSPGRRELVLALFNRTQHQRLIEDGLIRTPDGRGGAVAPLFAFGGQADVSLVLRRVPDRPSDDRWTKTAVVSVDRAGLVPQHFPLPIVARGIEVTIDDDDIALTGGRYEGLTGGEAFVTAELDQENRRPGRDPLPVIDIRAKGIPIDQRLLAAIPGYRDARPDAEVSLRSILDNLRVDGIVECQAAIGPRSDGSLGFDVEANMYDATARPRAWAADPAVPVTPPGVDPLVVDDLDGTVYVTERLIVVDLSGELSAPGTPLVPTQMSLLTQLTLPDRRGGLGDVEREGGLLPIQQGPPLPGPGLYADARAESLDLAMPLEHAAAVVSPQLAERLAALREQRHPDGVVSLRAEVEGIVGGHTETLLAVDRVESFAFSHEGERVRIGPSRGRAEVVLGNHPSVRFHGFATPVVSAGQPAGDLVLDGLLPLARFPATGEVIADGALHAVVRGGRLGVPVARQLIRAAAGQAASDWIVQRGVLGQFDLDVTVRPIRDAAPRALAPDSGFGVPALAAEGLLQPRSLALELSAGRISFEEIEGRVTFDGLTGRIDGVRASAPGVSIAADGQWSYSPGAGVGVDVSLGIGGERLSEAFRALLPVALVDVLDRFQVSADGAVVTDGLRLSASGIGTPSPQTRVSGAVVVDQARALVGLPLTEMAARIAFDAQVNRDGPTYAVDLTADRLRAGSLRVEQARATIIADAARPGVILVPELTGRVHGGRIAGTMQSHISGSSSRYWLDLHGSDIRAAPVFDDLLLPPGGLAGPPLPGEEAVRSAWSVSDDYTRGVLDADISLSGVVGDPTKTTGQGVLRVAGGSVIALPGIINLIEFSNLKAPVGAQLDLAEAVFYVDGTTLAFERLTTASRTVEILGYGTMDWITRDMDLRFRSRAVRPVPVLSGLFEALRDELITTRITGRPGNIRFAAESFGGTRRLVRALLGEPETEQERIMSAVEAGSREGNNRSSARQPPVVMPSRDPAAWADEYN